MGANNFTCLKSRHGDRDLDLSQMCYDNSDNSDHNQGEDTLDMSYGSPDTKKGT